MLTVGQKLWMVLYGRNNWRGSDSTGKEVSVVKVGRAWATLSEPSFRPYRISLTSMCIDGGQYSSPGRCFLSRAEYEETMLADKEWEALRFNYGRPKHITRADIAEIKRIVESR